MFPLPLFGGKALDSGHGYHSTCVRGAGEGGEEEEKRGREEEGVKMGRRKGGGYPTYTTCCYVGRMDRWTEGRMDRPTEGKTN